MRDEALMLSYRAQIESIVAQIEAAKIDNAVRLQQGLPVNYGADWFNEMANHLTSISEGIWKYA